MAQTQNPFPMSRVFAELKEQVLSQRTHYTVTVTNRTVDTIFDRIVCFYNRKGQTGVVFLENLYVVPQGVVVFDLGVCPSMESYVIGFFIVDDLVAQIPASGNMTPQLSSLLNPGDTAPCQDAWSITD